MIVDCATCPVRGQRCEGCVVTVLLAHPVAPVQTGIPLDAAERAAVAMFVDAGLIDQRRAETLRAHRTQKRGGRAG